MSSVFHGIPCLPNLSHPCGNSDDPSLVLTNSLAAQVLAGFTPSQRELLSKIAVSFNLIELHPSPSKGTAAGPGLATLSASVNGTTAESAQGADEFESSRSQEMYASSQQELDSASGDIDIGVDTDQNTTNVTAGKHDPELEELIGTGKERMVERLKILKEHQPYFLAR